MAFQSFPPTSARATTMVTTVVDTSVGTKQTLLSAVPTGYQRVVVEAIIRADDSDTYPYATGETYGFNAAANDWYPTSDGAEIGTAGDVFGIMFTSTGSTTPSVDTFYYDVAV